MLAATITVIGFALAFMVTLIVLGGVFELAIRKSKIIRTLYEDFYFRCRGEELRK